MTNSDLFIYRKGTFYFMIVSIFTLILIGLNILFFVKKKYLYLFIPCMLFLPSFYAIEISESLPLITVTRIMFIVFYCYAFVNRKREFSFEKKSLSSIPIEYIFILGYFVLRVFSNCYYAFKEPAAINAIFSIIFEQLLFLIALWMLAPTHEETVTVLKSIVYTATFLFVVGLFESFTLFKPLDFLYTVSRSVPNEYYIRLGLLRATTTMGMPVVYGNMCILVYPIILYLYNATRQKHYLAILLLNVLATIHSGSRADIFFFILINIIYFVLILIAKDKPLEHIKKATILLLLFLLLIGCLRQINSHLKYYYDTTLLSILNEVGFDFDLNQNAPQGVAGYGVNETTGSASRTAQLSGISRALSINPLFGQGAGALKHNDVLFKWEGKWLHWDAIDLGIVEIGIFEGLLGIIGYLSLFVGWIIFLLRNYKSYNSLSKLLIVLLLPNYILCTLSTANLYGFLFTYIFITFSLVHDGT